MSLSLADIKRADVQSFRDVAAGLEKMATANADMKSGVGRLPIAGDAWKGVSGDAAHHELDGFGRLLEGSADAKKGAAAKIRRAADEFEGVKQLLIKIEQDAAKGKFKIDMSTGKVTPPSGDYDKSELDYFTNTLRQIMQAGDAADADLAAAVKAAKELPDPSGSAAAALPTTPTATVKPGGAFGAVQNLATANPDGAPGETKAAAAGADTQANYKDWYPKTAAPAGDKLTMDPTKAGTLTGSMGAMEKNRPPPDKYKPAWGEGVLQQVADGVNGRTDAVIGAFNDARNLLGLGGEGAPGVADSWKDLAGSAGEAIKEHLTTPPIVGIVDGLKHNINEPTGQYIGEKLFDAGAIAAGGPVGAEGALARTSLEETALSNAARLPEHPNLPQGLHEPVSGHGPVEPPNGPTHPAPVSEQPTPTEHHAPAADAPDHHVPAADVTPPSTTQIGDWLHEINRGPEMDPFDPARAVNCGQCALAVEQRLSGVTPDATAGHGTLSIEEMEAATGKQQVAATPSEIAKYLVDQGAGSHTVVGVDRAGDMAGHWFNAYYDGKNVWAVDGQTNEIHGWPPDMDIPGHPVINWDMGVPKK